MVLFDHPSVCHCWLIERLYIWVCKVGIAAVFIYKVIETILPFIDLEYKITSGGYLVDRIFRKQFHQFVKKKSEISIFQFNHKIFYLYLSNKIFLGGAEAKGIKMLRFDKFDKMPTLTLEAHTY